jgi:hypothetical protein
LALRLAVVRKVIERLPDRRREWHFRVMAGCPPAANMMAWHEKAFDSPVTIGPEI